MINLIIVDDHSVVRKGLIQILLDEKPGIYSIDEASSGEELLEKVVTKKYDVIILDISMPGKDGIDTLKSLKKSGHNKAPVLIFSMYPEFQYAIRLLKAGAAGFINKECSSEEFIKALERVHRGGKYVSAELAEILLDSVDISDTPQHEMLSDREFQVMCMIAKGRATTQIAGELELSVNTVSTYRIRILEKLQLKNNSEITHYAIKNRLIE
jgi:DNA-binding NarL/FixJ family response regulator